MIVLLKSDFLKGKYCIPDSGGVYTNVDVQEIIDKYEKYYIYQLLGVALGDLLITYIQANATSNADYNKIINAFSADNTETCGGSIIQSLGMKEYLKAAIFYEYVKNGLKNSQAGVTKIQSETATAQDPASTLRFAENKFYDVLDTIGAIQWYCLENETAFPYFNGQCIKVKAANIL